jgi:hypothetical protein
MDIITLAVIEPIATGGIGTAYTTGASEFTQGFKLGSFCSIFSFLCSGTNKI